jgi:ribonuclease HI
VNEPKNNYKLYFDGACSPNPGGVASYGFILTLNDADEIDRGCGVIGKGKMMTDVHAELYALSTGLASFIRHYDKPDSKLTILGDSQYIIGQIKSEKPHSSSQMRIVCNQLNSLTGMNVAFEPLWIPREQNNFCDALAKRMRAMREAISKIA